MGAPTVDEDALFAEFDPWWMLTENVTQIVKNTHREQALQYETVRDSDLSGLSEFESVSSFLSDPVLHPVLEGLQPDLYRSFMERTWKNMADKGVVSLIRPESHFTEKRATLLRQAAYQRLRRHWQFINELQLFSEIHDLVVYGIHVYSTAQEHPSFSMASSFYHPETVERSLHHEGTDFIPTLKDDEGNWHSRPHPDRIINVNVETLTAWRDIIEDSSVPPLQASMISPVNRESMAVLEKLAEAPRASELNLHYSAGWHESSARRDGYFDIEAKTNTSWDHVILQGIHFSVANPFAKEPNETIRHNQDTVTIDLEAMPEDFIPRTKYQPTGDRGR